MWKLLQQATTRGSQRSPLVDSQNGAGDGTRSILCDSALRWDRERFLSGDGSCPSEIDVTGPPRYLIFGPFITLEPGLWRAEYDLELCPDASLRVLALQFGVEPDYTTLDIPRGQPGFRTVAIEHVLPVAGSVQLRLWLKKAAFHGHVRFKGASVTRVADAEPLPH
jgi:hypothetical protein